MVEYNDFREADPSPQSLDALLLRKDLSQLKHPRTGVLVDVGWYGDAGGSAAASVLVEPDRRRQAVPAVEELRRARPRAQPSRAGDEQPDVLWSARVWQRIGCPHLKLFVGQFAVLSQSLRRFPS